MNEHQVHRVHFKTALNTDIIIHPPIQKSVFITFLVKQSLYKSNQTIFVQMAIRKTNLNSNYLLLVIGQ